MGYALSNLGNLPIQDEIDLYIFVVGSSWKDETYEAIENNFMELARRIGPKAVIAKGFEPEAWSSQICDRYLGKNVETLSRTSRNQKGWRGQHNASAMRAILNVLPIYIRPNIPAFAGEIRG